MWYQKKIKLFVRPRGFHVITQEIIQKCTEINKIKIGIANIFIQHTSASLMINESVDSNVRTDFENYFNTVVRENESYYKHNDEGSDDMPAHLKSSLLGNSIVIPIKNGNFNMGIWQGIYFCEHRNSSKERHIVITLHGEKRINKI